MLADHSDAGMLPSGGGFVGSSDELRSSLRSKLKRQSVKTQVLSSSVGRAAFPRYDQTLLTRHVEKK